jgi:hypothetical protein
MESPQQARSQTESGNEVNMLVPPPEPPATAEPQPDGEAVR